MSTLEDRVRAAFRADAETVRPETIPGVPKPGIRRGLRKPRVRLVGTRSKTVRWLAPMAAVIAVVGVIAGVSLVARPQGQSSSRTPTGLPPYYVTLTGAVVSHRPVLTAAVRNSANGALLTTVKVPVRQKVGQPLHNASPSRVAEVPPPMPSGITASASGRTFVITDDLGFFLLRVAADGRSAQLSRLPINASYVLSDPAALSPDGNQLAIDVESCTEACREGIEVVSLATGASKLWIGPSMTGSLVSPAWVANGAEIMFLWQVVSSSVLQGYRLLNVSGPSGSLLGSSRAMISPPTERGWEFAGALLTTPDGRGLITTMYRNVPSQDGGGTATLRVVELSARTGQLRRVLHVATEHYSAGWVAKSTADAGCQVLSLGPTGLHALVQCPGLGRLDDDRFTALPGVPVTMNGGTGIGGTAAW